MEVPEKGPLQSMPIRNKLAERLQQPSARATGAQEKRAGKDTVDPTKSDIDVSETVKDNHALPVSREDRVMQLKRQLETGTYRVKGHRIAVNMIDEALENNQVIKHIDSKV